MRAVVIDTIAPAEQITLTDIPIPEVKSGWALVKIRAFGLNHSEYILRHEEIESACIRKPVIPGIECVGEIAGHGDTRFAAGQKVCALMGGMGRIFNLKNTVGSIYLERKLAAKLWKLARDFGVSVPNGIEIDVTLPVTMLADLLGAPRGTTSRLCRKLIDHGLIKVSGKRIVITDPEKEILVFLRSCDLHAVKRLDEIYLKNGFEDFYYARVREKARFILMGCESTCESGFCVSMGTNRSDYYDAYLKADGETVWLDVKCAELAEGLEGTECGVIPAFVTENKEKVTLPKNLSNDSFTPDIWKEYGSRCIACGRCEAVCTEYISYIHLLNRLAKEEEEG